MPSRHLRPIILERRATFVSLVVALFLGGGLAQAAELVVFETHDTSLRSGQLIDGNDLIQLEAGQKITLISMDGKLLTLTGPFNGAAAPRLKQGGGGVLDALQGLTSERDKDRTVLGVARKPGFGKDAIGPVAGETVALPGPWMVDITSPGDWCYRNGDTIELWRPEERQAGSVALTTLDETWEAIVEWPSGSRTISLSSDVPIKDNAKIWFTVDGKDTLIAFRAVPAGMPTREAKAAWMAAKNCVQQARVLVGEAR